MGLLFHHPCGPTFQRPQDTLIIDLKHYNEQFYESHPSMFVLLDNIAKLQVTAYIKLRSANAVAVRSSHNSKKETFPIEKYGLPPVCKRRTQP